MSKTYKDTRQAKTNRTADVVHFKPLKHKCDEHDWDKQLQMFLDSTSTWNDDDGIAQED